PVFRWSPVPGAAKYRFQISPTSDFATKTYDVDTTQSTATPTTDQPPSSAGSPLYWRVTAISTKGTTGPWATARYVHTWDASPADPAPAESASGFADLQYPFSPPTLSWDPLPGARSYQVEIDDANDFIGATSYATPNTAITVPINQTIGQVWSWHVRGISSIGSLTSQWSPTLHYQLSWPRTALPANYPASYPGAQTGYPALAEPQPGATLSEVRFVWTPVAGAAGYQLDVSPNQDFTNNTISTVVKGSSYSPLTTLDVGAYYWRVRAVDALTGIQNFGAWSPGPGDPLRSFTKGPYQIAETVSPTVPSAEEPTLIPQSAPGSYVTMAEPSLAWTPVSHASAYELQISTNPGFLENRTTMACIVNHTSYTPYLEPVGAKPCPGYYPYSGIPSGFPTRLATGTQYYWRVRGIDDDGPAGAGAPVHLAWSFPVSSFRLTAPPTSTPQSSMPIVPSSSYGSPAGCAPGSPCTVHDTPRLSWAAQPNADQYAVYLSPDPLFSSNQLRILNTTYTSLTPADSLKDNQAGQSWYWFVRPCNHGTTGLVCGAFDESTYGTAGAFHKQSYPVLLDTPATNAGANGQVELRWQDFLATSTSDVTQEARSYHLQVSTSQDFSAVVDDVYADALSYTPYTKTYPEGPLYWRVQAVDGSNNLLTWSDPGAVTPHTVLKQTARLAGASPADNATVKGLQAFSWVPQPYAAKYEIELYKDSGLLFPSANRVASAVVAQASWTPTLALPAGRYDWRVRRLDADARPGPWSPGNARGAASPDSGYSLTLLPDPPTLQSPANTAYTHNGSILLQWVGVAGASAYAVDIAPSASFSSATTTTTVTSAWAPVTHLADGVYYWRVRALNAAAELFSVSAVRSFTVSDVSPYVARAVPVASASVSGPFTVTFSASALGVDPTTFLVRLSGSAKAVPGFVTGSGRTWAWRPQHPLVMGATYGVTLSARIHDRKGAALAPYHWTVRTAATADDTNGGVQETWTVMHAKAASGGGYARARNGGDELTLRFRGKSVVVLGERFRSGGLATVYLDGVKVGSLSSHGAAAYRVRLWSRKGLPLRNHVLRIVLTGSPPRGSSGNAVGIDAFVVDGRTSQESSGAVTTRFRHVASRSATGHSYSTTDAAMATYRGRFLGSSITWYAVSCSACGLALVRVDGGHARTVDLYAARTTGPSAAYTLTGLPQRVHTITVTVLAKKRAAATGTSVTMDSLRTG
ncbi:MAG: large repetitive protein, partial [Frankiales bacterium]|nr:large repetitive protein [Frankiales bacterium]